MPNLLVPLGPHCWFTQWLFEDEKTRKSGQRNGRAIVKKYEKSRLTLERSERYLDKLLNFMRKEKPFTDVI